MLYKSVNNEQLVEKFEKQVNNLQGSKHSAILDNEKLDVSLTIKENPHEACSM